MNLNPDNKYAYAMAVISWYDQQKYPRTRYGVDLISGEAERIGVSNPFFPSNGIKADPKLIGKINAPQLGDIVIVRSLRTGKEPNGFGISTNPVICQIVKRMR